MVSVGSDHAGFELKSKIIEHLKEKGIELIDRGTYSSESTDYPEFAHSVAKDVGDGACSYGILICGSANGVAMSANKHAKIRCAICWNKELSELARAHNDANIVALPARFINERVAIEIVDAFLEVEFEGGRHQRRVAKIAP